MLQSQQNLKKSSVVFGNLVCWIVGSQMTCLMLALWSGIGAGGDPHCCSCWWWWWSYRAGDLAPTHLHRFIPFETHLCYEASKLRKDLVAFGLVSTYGDLSASRSVLFAHCTQFLGFTVDVDVGAAKERKCTLCQSFCCSSQSLNGTSESSVVSALHRGVQIRRDWILCQLYTGVYKSAATEFCKVALNICGFSVWSSNVYDICIFNCNWVATRWQLFSTHKHTNNTGNVTKQTSDRTTQKNT
jgi:hypothetical protein